jgi:hypothetical protein
MALSIGDSSASDGMTKAIYDKINEVLSPTVPASDLAKAQDGWKKLAFAIATGVVGHIQSNGEIQGLAVSGTASLNVSNNVASGNVSLTQSGATTGLIH